MDAAEFDFRTAMDARELARLRGTMAGRGWFRIRHGLFPDDRCSEAVRLAQEFFGMPEAEKQGLAIEGSPHFRGYSVMHNARDWREQIHFGREEAASDGPVYRQLRGPNRWPADGRWQCAVQSLMEDLEIAARDVLGALARSLDLPAARFLAENVLPYVLLKMIHYQALPGAVRRSGVAPHVDFSWITLLLQDDAGGLEIRERSGAWQAAAPAPGTLVVNCGEILQFATGGYFRATPHRVVNGERSRVSLPFFLNPPLDGIVERVAMAYAGGEDGDDGGHVHRVFTTARREALRFGEEEWRRKGLGIYCGSCCGDGGEKTRTSASTSQWAPKSGTPR